MPPLRSALLSCALLLTAGAPAQAQPVATTDSRDALFTRYAVSGFAGYKSDAFTFFGGRRGDAFTLAGAGFEGALGRFGFDGNVHGLVSPSASGARSAIATAVRLGFAGEKLDARLGAVLQGTGSAGLQWVPSLHLRYDFGPAALSAGVFDQHGYMPAHVTVDVGNVSIGWVGLLGLRGAVRVPISDTMSLRMDALGFSVGNYQSAMVVLSTVVSGGETRAGEVMR